MSYGILFLQPCLRTAKQMGFPNTVLNDSSAHTRNDSVHSDGMPSARRDAEPERFFDLSLDMLCTANFEGHFVRLNPAFEMTLGYSREELRARPFLELVHPDDLTATRQAMEELVHGEKRLEIENRYRAKDGTWRWLAWKAVTDMEAQLIYATARDATQQRENEETLRELNATLEERVEKRAADLAEIQARFSTAMHNSAVGMALVGLDGHWLEVNQSLCRTLGYSSRELLATDFQSVTHPDDLERDLSQVRHLLAGDIFSYEMEKRYLHRDGSVIWGHLSVSLTRDAAGQPLYFISQIQDITKRKRAELELIQSEERFRLMIDCVQDYAIFMLDTEGQVASWNQGAERTTGYAAADILGRPFSIFFPAGVDGPAVAASLLAQASASGDVKDEGWRLRKDGRKIWAEVVLTAVHDSAGRLRGYANVTHDLTKRREAETQSLRSQRLEAIGNIASGVAHDLNNALGPIILGLDLLRATYPKEIGLVDTFESCGRRAADMVQQLVSFARGAEGEHVPVQLPYLLREMQKIIPSILPKNIQTSWQWPEDLACINGDPTQIHQILLNLCVNARDAMPNGGRLAVQGSNVEVDEVFASSQEGARPGHYVRIDVSDTGQGIPPNIIERIFEPFFTTKSPDKGSGLGLATVMGIVKGHGGFLNVYSQLGAGATFSFYLPVSPGEAGVEEEASPTVKYHGHGEKILVVDDEATIREVSRRVLQRLNFEPITATDGADALVHIAKSGNELKAVITDMHMPHMDGIGLVRAIRRMVPGLRVVVASGRLEESEKRELEGLHIVGLLHKPFTEEELASVLEGVIGEEAPPLSHEALFAF